MSDPQPLPPIPPLQLGGVEPHAGLLAQPPDSQLLYKLMTIENLLRSIDGAYLHFTRVDQYTDSPVADSHDGQQLPADAAGNAGARFQKAPAFSAAHYYDRSRARTYPNFSVLITETNRRPAVQSALRALAGSPRARDATAVLDALEALDGDRIDPSKSRYAKSLLARLAAKGDGQVLNRTELFTGGLGVEYYDDGKTRLEPDWVLLVAACLVHSGDIVLAVAGDKIDSSRLSLLTERGLDDLVSFKHIERPKQLNVNVLRALFELLGLPPGHVQGVSQGDDAPVIALQSKLTTLVNELLTTQTALSGGLGLWGQNLLTDAEVKDARARLESLKTFCESLSPYNSVGKLKNIRVTVEDIEAQKTNLATLDLVKGLLKLSGDLSPWANYLAQAELALPADNAWVTTARDARAKLVSDFAAHRDLTKVPAMRQALEKLKKDYIAAYIGLHTKARLGVSEDKAKAGLTKDVRLVSLNRLATIDLMPSGQLTEFQDRMAGLKSCYQLTEGELATSPVCPHCQFRPVNETLGFASAANQLTTLDSKLDELLAGWTQTLLDNLDDPIIQGNLELLKAADHKQIEAFIASKSLPEPLTAEFIAAVRDALSGLTKEIVKVADIQAALLAGGSPTTPDELKARFDKFIAERTRGKDASKLRFIVE